MVVCGFRDFMVLPSIPSNIFENEEIISFTNWDIKPCGSSVSPLYSCFFVSPFYFLIHLHFLLNILQLITQSLKQIYTCNKISNTRYYKNYVNIYSVVYCSVFVTSSFSFNVIVPHFGISTSYSCMLSLNLSYHFNIQNVIWPCSFGDKV